MITISDIKEKRDRNQYSKPVAENLPDRSQTGNATFTKVASLRYGENPPAYPDEGGAASYIQDGYTGPSVATAEKLNGKELSFNNLRDADLALRLARRIAFLFPESAAAVLIKHKGPCGAARAERLADAHALAYDCDPEQAFGGVNAYSKIVDADTARQIVGYFNEVVLAPGYTEEALGILKTKENLRVLRIPQFHDPVLDYGIEESTILGGKVAQRRQISHIDAWENLEKISSGRDPTPEELNAALFNWNVAVHTPSNAVILGNDYRTVGIGRGQGGRMDSANLAIEYTRFKAKADPAGYLAASDAFFPQKDAPQKLFDAGVRAIVYPLGSIKDAEVLDLANEYGAVMLCTRPIPGTKAIERAFSH